MSDNETNTSVVTETKAEPSKVDVKAEVRKVEVQATSSKGTVPPKIVPPAQPSPLKAVGTPIEVPVKVVQTEFEKSFDAYIDKQIASGSDLTIKVIEFLQKYIVDLAPGKEIDFFEGAKYQQSFYKLIHHVIEKTENEEFRKNWIVILSFFHRYRNEALGVRYVNRFAEFWSTNDEALTAFQRIINLIVLSANPEERQFSKNRVNITKTLEIGFTETGRANINQFYNV